MANLGTLGGATLGSIALAGSPTSHLTAGLLGFGKARYFEARISSSSSSIFFSSFRALIPYELHTNTQKIFNGKLQTFT